MLDDSLISTVKELQKFKDFEVKFIGEERFPSQGQSGEWREEGLKNITSIIENLKEYSSYYTPQFSEEVKIRLTEVIIIYKKILELIIIEDIENFSLHFDRIKALIPTIIDILRAPKVKEISSTDFKIEDFFKIGMYLIITNQLFSLHDFIETVTKENNRELYFKITNELIKYNNYSLQEKAEKSFQLLPKLFSFYQDIVQETLNQKREELRNEVNKVNSEKLQAIEEIERAKNSLIITAFKDKSDSSKDYINILYCLISFLFLVIIASLFFRLNIKPDEKFHLLPFLYFVSYITAISSFLAFLIREKNRLVAQSDYFNRCHVELSALPTYVYDLEKSKIENLKIELAHKYFTGGTNTNENNNNQELNISNENIKQMLEIIKEVSKK